MAGRAKHALRSRKTYREHRKQKYYLKGKDPHTKV